MTTFKAFPEIELPSALQALGFVDTSWYNEAAGSCVKTLANGQALRVWVDHDDPEQRELPNAKFIAELLPINYEYGNEASVLSLGHVDCMACLLKLLSETEIEALREVRS